MGFLMYLSLRGINVINVFNFIEEFRYLEYLDFKYIYVFVLLKEVCKFYRLRYFLVFSNNIGNFNIFNNILGVDVFGFIGVLFFL